MREYIFTTRPERNFSTLRRAPTLAVRPRSLERKTVVARMEQGGVSPPLVASQVPFQIDPYFDYGRFLTAEGGILITYKDLDLRWRHIIWRVLAWATFTGFEADYLFNLAPTQNLWIAVVVLVAVAVANWLIVAKPIELYRRIEIRPDCMIVDGSDVFWVRFMEGGLPSCRPNAESNLIFCGTYGTRFVEYLTIRRFDENDRMPEIMSAHLQEAMRQLWAMPH
jgi:hypothetical protein